MEVFLSLVEAIFGSFTTVIGGLAEGLQTAFTNLIYVGGDVSAGMSPLVIFVFVMAGVGIATGLLYKIFGLIKGMRKGA